MIEIRSLLWGDDGFVPLEEAEPGIVDDRRYVDGAIELVVDGTEVLGREHRDLVDQLWAYLGEGLLRVAENLEWETRFPDQPIKLRMVPDRRSGVVRVEVTSGGERTGVAAPRGLFLRETALASLRFWAALERLVPGPHPDAVTRRPELEALAERLSGEEEERRGW